MINYNRFALILKQLRKNKALSLRELAGKCSLPPSTIYAYEHNYISEPNMKHIEAICFILEINLVDMIFLIDDTTYDKQQYVNLLKEKYNLDLNT